MALKNDASTPGVEEKDAMDAISDFATGVKAKGKAIIFKNDASAAIRSKTVTSS